MPTTAQQQLEEDLMRQAVAQAQIAAQRGAADAASRAAMYTADRGLDATRYTSDNALTGNKYLADTGLTGQKYVADTGLTGIKDTNQARLTGTAMEQQGMTGRTGMEQTGATERAGIAIKPQMGALDLQKTIYGDERTDKTNTPDYILGQALADQVRSKFRPSQATGQTTGPTGGPNVSPQLPTTGAPGTVQTNGAVGNPNDKLLDQMLSGYMRKQYGEDPTASTDREIQKMLKMKAVESLSSADPEVRAGAEKVLGGGGIAVPAGAFAPPRGVNPALVERQAGLSALVAPALADLTAFVRKNNWNMSNADDAQLMARMDDAKRRLAEVGATPEQLADAERQMQKAVEDALQENGVFFTAAGSDTTRSKLAARMNQGAPAPR